MLEDKLSLFIGTVLKNGTKYKCSILILDEHVVLCEHLVHNLLDKVLGAVVDHSLDDSATILVLAEHDIVFLNLRDEVLKCLGGMILAHVHQDLLDNVVSVKVYRTIEDVAVLVQLLEHLFLLLDRENLESSLDDSAAMLVGG